MIYTKNLVGKKAEINLHHSMFLWCLFRNDVIIAAAVSCRAVGLQLPLKLKPTYISVSEPNSTVVSIIKAST